MTLVLVLVLQSGDNGRAPGEGRLASEHGVRLRMEADVFVLDVQVLWQLDRFQRIQWKRGIHGRPVEYQRIV